MVFELFNDRVIENDKIESWKQAYSPEDEEFDFLI